MNQYSTAQLIGEIVKRLEAEGPDESLIGSGITVERIELGDEVSGCSCCNTDDLAGLPADDDALAFVAAMALGGTGEFTPVQDHELDGEEVSGDSGLIEITSEAIGGLLDSTAVVTASYVHCGMEQARIVKRCNDREVPSVIESLSQRMQSLVATIYDDDE